MRAGGAVVDITPGVGIAMGGYGARQGVSSGIHDNLNVRTVVFDDGSTRIALAVCDLVAVPPDIVDGARRIIEEECGIPPTHVCVSATHTHSGPGTLRTRDAPDFVAMTARKIAGSVRIAVDRLASVTLKANSFEVATISQNRRDPAGPIVKRGEVLLADPGGGAAPAVTVI